MASAEAIIKRFKKAQGVKTNWAETYEDALDYAAPGRNTFDEEFPGQEKTNKGKVFDSTAISAMHKFASNIQSSLTPSMRSWIKLQPGATVDDTTEARETLAEITDTMFAHINNSNFDTQIAESYLDLSIGTGALLVQKGPSQSRPLQFTNVPLSQLFLEEGPHGRVDVAFRKHKVALRNIIDMWPDGSLNDELQERMERKPDDQINLIEATIPDKVQVFNRQIDAMEEIDGYRYIVVAENQAHVIVEREQRSSPWVIFRWSALPGEMYGRGPVLQALPDIKTINKTKELLLKAASIGTFGMYTATDNDVMNVENIKFGPGVIIPVESNAGGVRGASLAPLTTSSDVNLAQIVINDLRQSINEMLFAEPLGPVDLPVKTATEVSLRQQELSKRIGSAFGRLQFELITPLINRVLDLLDEQGLIDIGPYRVDGNVIAIQHISPLALAQNEEEFSNMLRYAETLTNLFGPQIALGLLNPDVFSRVAADKLNVPQEVVPTEQQFEVLKQALSQQAAQGGAGPAQALGG